MSAPDFASALGVDLPDDITALDGAQDDRDWLARAKIRASCRKSLFFMTKVVSCYAIDPNLMTRETFLESCEWLEYVLTESKRGVFEDPRDHIKSYRTTVTIPQWIAIQIPDERYDHPNEVARARAWLAANPNIRGVNTRIIIGSESMDRSKEWSKQSRTQWELNPLLRWAFPELLWPNPKNPDYGSWSDESYSLPGRTDPTQPAPYLRAISIHSKESGRRADVIILDDILSEKTKDSPGELTYRWDWVRSITQLLDKRTVGRGPGGVVLLVTNRKNLDDPNSKIHDGHGGEQWSIWHRGASECVVHGRSNCGRQPSDIETDCAPNGRPIWPEKHPDLEIIRADLGDQIYFTEWENDPVQQSEFDTEKFLAFDIDILDRNTSNGVQRGWHVNVPEQRDREGRVIAAAESIRLADLVEHRISIDPAGADEDSEARKAGKTARWCASWFAMDAPTNRVFWLACEAGHWAPDDAIEACYSTWRTASEMLGRPVEVICERVAAQTLVASALKLRAQADGLKSELGQVEMIPPARGLQKDTRIRQRFGWRLNQHKLYVRAGIMLPRLEARHFPSGTKDSLDTEVQYEQIALERGGMRRGRASQKAAAARRRNRLARAGRTGAW